MLQYLIFDLSDDDHGITTLDALASTTADRHPAVLAEVQQVLDWAWQQFPHGHGPVDEGMDWDHDLQVSVQAGGWHEVSLTLSGSSAFADAFFERFGHPAD